MKTVSNFAVYLDDFDTSTDDLISRLRLVEAERDRWRTLAGGGCDANAGGEHEITVMGTYKHCVKCGESITSTRDRIISLVDRNLQLNKTLREAQARTGEYRGRATRAEQRVSELESALDRALTAALNAKFQ